MKLKHTSRVDSVDCSLKIYSNYCVMRTSYLNSELRALVRHSFNSKQVNISDAMSTTLCFNGERKYRLVY